MGGSGVDEGSQRLRALLLCTPPSATEANWNWKKLSLSIHEAISKRSRGPGGTYNGHPVIPTYFGAYCMDGLAMALWGLWHSQSFSGCMLRVINLLGDADTTGAIAGQMAGALYGLRGIASCEWGSACLQSLKRWDPHAEIAMRAALLYHRGPRTEVTLKQAEGFNTVRVFAEARSGSDMVGEVPNGEKVQCLRTSVSFVCISWQEITGWVGFKNVVPVRAQGVDEAYMAKASCESRPSADLAGYATLNNSPGVAFSGCSNK